MSQAFSRAQFLRIHRRHEEAVTLLLGHLTHFPDDAAAYIELALNRLEIPGEKSMALADARTATGLMPGSAFPLALQSRILSQMDREKEALPLAESAVALDPEDVYCWNAKTLALCGLSEWKAAEASARQALSLHADDDAASNLLSHILRMQNRLDESEAETRRRLALDPENAFSFDNAGWAALQRNQIQQAETYFKEALRLNPELIHAKMGLKEAYRARSGFFRLFLRWIFFIQRFNRKHRFAIVIGTLVAFQVARFIAASVNPLLTIPVVFIYFVAVFGSWLAGPVASFLILKDPVARMALDTGEKIEGLMVGCLLGIGFTMACAGVITMQAPISLLGAGMVLTALPGSLIFTNSSFKGRCLFSGCAVAVLGLAIFAATNAASRPVVEALDGGAGDAVIAAILIVGLVTWLGQVESLRQARPT